MTSDVRIARKKPKRVARGDPRDSCQAPTSWSSCLYGAIHGLFLSHSFDFSRAILVNFSRRAAPKRDSFSCRCSALDPAPPPPPRAPVSAMGQNVVHIDPPATRPRFHNVEPRSREARLAIRDKDMLEKLRLEHRLKSNVKEDLNSNLLEPPPNSAGFISEADRFCTDAAGEEYAERHRKKLEREVRRRRFTPRQTMDGTFFGRSSPSESSPSPRRRARRSFA